MNGILLFFWASLVASGLAMSDSKIDLAMLGPVYQAAANTSFQAFTDAKIQANKALNQAIATGNTTYGPFDNQATSFSVSVFSITSSEPLFEFHFEAPQLNGSYTKGKLTENTVYRSGSLGKLMTIYTWLVNIGDSVYTDPITKYVVSIRPVAVVEVASSNVFTCTARTRASHPRLHKSTFVYELE
jgi:hypothetical protein